MRILVLGATGMLGHKLIQRLGARFEMTGAVRGHASSLSDHPVLGGVPIIGGVQAEDIDSVVRAVAEARPDCVINAIGLIKQLPGAKAAIPSITINSLFPHRLAQICQAAHARLFHMSTDCVFSGRDGNYTEDHTPDCEDLYGRSKLLGEVNAEGCMTLRTSIVGRELRTTSGLFEWFISQRGGTARGFDRAIYTGLTTSAVADVIAMLAIDHPKLHGVWQVASEQITKYELLQKLNRHMRLDITLDKDVDFACNRSLIGKKFEAATGWTPPTWDEMIAEFVADPTPYATIRAGG